MYRAEYRQNERIIAAQLSRSFGQRPCQGLASRNGVRTVVHRTLSMAPTSERQSKRILWVDCQCLIEQFERLGTRLILKHPDMRHRTHSVVVGAQILRRLAS